MTPEQKRQRFVEAARANDAAIRSILTAQQLRRLRQIAIQVRGLAVFQEPEIVAALKLTAEQSRDVEAKLANITRKDGERLSDEQRKHLRRILAYNETMLAPIRAYALQNGDAPVTVLKVSSAKSNE